MTRKKDKTSGKGVREEGASYIAKTGRFDTKLSPEQKAFFERAADIGQYRSLSDFVLKAAQEKAEEIIARHESFLASARDRETFFNALLNPPSPNSRLRNAMKDYLSLAGRS